MGDALPQAHHPYVLLYHFCRFRPGLPPDQQREHHILQHGVLGDQMVLLEDEPDLLVAQSCQASVIAGVHIHTVQKVLPGVRCVHTPDDIHKRGLSRPGRAQDRQVLALVDGQADPLQYIKPLAAGGIGLFNLAQCYNVFRIHPVSPKPQWTGCSCPPGCPQ